jgi:hypothetical protein
VNIKRIAIGWRRLWRLTVSGVNVSVNMDESGGASITVRMDEARLNDLLRNSSASTERDGLLTEIEHVEFLEGRCASAACASSRRNPAQGQLRLRGVHQRRAAGRPDRGGQP